ncbi:MAG: response regulator transcription factor [Spirochaetia bacterium]
MSRVLIVEDDADIAAAVSDHLHREAIESEQLTYMAPVAERIRQGDIDVILLDVMLPDGSGFDLCRDLRHAGHTIPIIMLTARNEDNDQILGLGLGADDYVTKPFSAATLIARIKAQLRRANDYTHAPRLQRFPGPAASAGIANLEHSDHHASRGAPLHATEQPERGVERGSERHESTRELTNADREVVSLGDRVVDFAASEIRRGDRALDMTAKERELLSVLVRGANRVFTRDRLFTIIWGDDHFGDPGTVAVHIRRLREKLEDDPSAPRFLQTVRGLGYRFRPGDPPRAENTQPAAAVEPTGTAPADSASAYSL